MISFALYASVVVVYKRNGIISQNVLYSVNIFTFVYHDKVKHTIMAVIYPIGIQNFEKLRKDGYLYIDKTAFVHELATTGSYYFLSRPRRFGKSLLISTLEAYFEGKKELFEGLALENLEKDWIKHPILHIDLNTEKYNTPESLERILNFTLLKWEKLYGTGAGETSLALRFRGIVERAVEQTGQRVVILIDEYDKPMLQAIGNEELQAAYRSTLKSFYSVMKTMDKYIRFAFLTGVTKFGKVSVFSDLNNLQDISMDKRYVDVCGISEKEIHDYLEPQLHELAKANKQTYEEICQRLELNYDGYHFVENSIGIYNPFSLLNTFKTLKFGSYWFETGTPTYLVELLKRAEYDLSEIGREEIDADVLNSIDIASYNPIPVIYQSGYLTIKGYDEEFGMYTLGFPNKEVEEGFMRYLLPFYTTVKEGETAFQLKNFVTDLRKGNPEGFLRRLQTFFYGVPYELTGGVERYYQNVLFIVCRLMGLYVQAEYHTSYGRADMILQTKDYIYIFEFKLDGSVEEALQQIESQGYARPFEMDRRKLVKIGVKFDSRTRSMDKWKIS